MTATPSSGHFAMVDPSHVAEVGPAAAILFARISWRSERDGSWRATRAVLSQETGLSQAMLRTAVDVLRQHDWVRTERTSTEDATLIWTPVYAGHADIADSTTPLAESAPPPCEIRTTPPAESAISSYQTGKDLDTPPTPPADEDTLLPLALVPALSTPEPVDDGQPAPGDPRWFAFFWEHWPRKVAKAHARKMWDRAVREGTHPLVMLRGLADQKAILAGRGEFCPHPGSWINGRRWEDTVADISPVDLRNWRGNPFAAPDLMDRVDQITTTNPFMARSIQ